MSNIEMFLKRIKIIFLIYKCAENNMMCVVLQFCYKIVNLDSFLNMICFTYTVIKTYLNWEETSVIFSDFLKIFCNTKASKWPVEGLIVEYICLSEHTIEKLLIISTWHWVKNGEIQLLGLLNL